MYQLRGASQGDDIYLDVGNFLKDRGADTKAFHHRYERVGLQESSPQNNFRRIIACRIPKGEFCNHTINYTTKLHSRIDLTLVMFVLNSAFADWYFRLGSTNAHVSHYQLTNIPCPLFNLGGGTADTLFAGDITSLIMARDFSAIEQKCLDRAGREACSPTVEVVIEKLVRFIESEEKGRGQIIRSERSQLAEDAEKAQVILDKIMLVLLGLDPSKHDYIRSRLAEML
jgi:hypothetical protein